MTRQRGRGEIRPGYAHPTMFFHGCDTDRLALIGETMIAWSTAETMVYWACCRLAETRPEDDNQPFRRRIRRRLSWIKRHEDSSEDMREVASLLRDLVDEFIGERHTMAHGMFVFFGFDQSVPGVLEREESPKVLSIIDFERVLENAKKVQVLAEVLNSLSDGHDYEESRKRAQMKTVLIGAAE